MEIKFDPVISGVQVIQVPRPPIGTVLVVKTSETHWAGVFVDEVLFGETADQGMLEVLRKIDDELERPDDAPSPDGETEAIESESLSKEEFIARLTGSAQWVITEMDGPGEVTAWFFDKEPHGEVKGPRIDSMTPEEALAFTDAIWEAAANAGRSDAPPGEGGPGAS